VTHLFIRMLVICMTLLMSASAQTLIESGTRGRLSLDGTWSVIGVDGILPVYPPPDEKAGWQTAEIPSQSAAPHIITQGSGPYTINALNALITRDSKFRRNSGIAAWFKRAFLAPSATSIGDRRIVLYMHGAAFRSDIYLNGQPVGTSVQALLPNSYDARSTLQSGSTSPWQNPHPSKTISHLDAVGNLGTSQVVLVAITGELF